MSVAAARGRRRRAAGVALTLCLTSGCSGATEEELACARVRDAAVDRAQDLGLAAGVAVVLLLVAVTLVARPTAPGSAVRGVVAALLVLLACPPAAALGLVLAAVEKTGDFDCGDDLDIGITPDAEAVLVLVFVATPMLALLLAAGLPLYGARAAWYRAPRPRRATSRQGRGRR